MKKITTIVLIVVFAAFIGISAYAYTALSGGQDGQAARGGQDGQAANAGQSEDTPKIKAPDFTVEDANGEQVKLSDMLGKPVVLNFWASWCPPCKSEMPEFDKVYNDLGDKVQFMMVNMTDGQRETVATGSKYVSNHDFSFPVYFDTAQEAAYAYGIQSIPTTVFIDEDGYIVAAAQGAIDEKTLRNGVSRIVSASAISKLNRSTLTVSCRCSLLHRGQ